MTNQRETPVIWDKKTGIPISNAIVWQCRRTSELVESIAQDYGVMIKEKTPEILDHVQCSIEYEKLGTGGAVKKAIDRETSSSLYLMNVDDIIACPNYTPSQLIQKSSQGGALLLAKTTFPFGVVETQYQYMVGFKQKPILAYWINTGHYALTREIVEQHFPERGNFEDPILPQMAKNKQLQHHKLDGDWITINNIKQLDQAKQRLAEINTK